MFELKKFLALNKIASNLYIYNIICFEDELKNNIDTSNNSNNFDFKIFAKENNIIENAQKTINICLNKGTFNGKSHIVSTDDISNITKEDKINTFSDLYACIYCMTVLNDIIKSGKANKGKNKNINITAFRNNINENDILDKCIEGINSKIKEI